MALFSYSQIPQIPRITILLPTYTVPHTIYLVGGDHDHVVGQLLDLLPDYKITNQPRISRGGGLAVLSRSELTIRAHTGAPYASFEYMDLILTSGGMSIRVISIYRPPPSVKNKLSSILI